jgi:hypothetical protein
MSGKKGKNDKKPEGRSEDEDRRPMTSEWTKTFQ